jgi:dTDP-4-amino-4,6-dideoxygalactose transaminase
MHPLNIKLDSMGIEKEDIKNLTTMLEKSQVTIFNSSLLDEFENKLSSYLSNEGNIKSVTLPNCTSAIYIALHLLDLQEGDEIIVPNITHASAILAIINLNKYKIIVCDYAKNSYDLDITSLKNLITKKTKAIIVSYLHGYPFNINEVKDFCDLNNLLLIEDTAQGLGVKIGSDMAGTIGAYGCFSFGANKLLKMGEGGALCYTKKSDLNRINKYRHVGEVWKESGLSTVSHNSTYEDILYNGFDYIEKGFNFRCNPLHVALSMRSLENLESIINIRQKKLEIYQEFLSTTKGIRIISDNVASTAPISAWFIIDPKYYNVNNIILKCLELHIPIGRFKYSTINKVKLFRENIINKDEAFPNSTYINQNSLFLPLYENISLDDVRTIAMTVKDILENYNELKYDKSILKKQIEYFNGFFLKYSS